MSVLNNYTLLEEALMKELDFVAQNAHLLTGISLSLVFALFDVPNFIFYLVPSYVALTAWKEFIYDEKFEIPEIRGSSLKDFVFYQIGLVTGLLIYVLKTIV